MKFGRDNGEVYGEVAGTRLLWALGFGADRMYPVRVVCRRCPAGLEARPDRSPDDSVFYPAAIERKARGTTIETYEDQGWAWSELDLVEEAAGGASRAQRDALKLLAVFMQAGDNKPKQQRLVCLDEDEDAKSPGKAPSEGEVADEAGGGLCRRPFMLMDDLGLTFGSVDMFDRRQLGSVNLARWSKSPVWKGERGCTGNLPLSLSGTLHDPEISEAGRAFLARLLGQLSDGQIRDLFDVARFSLRPADPSADHARSASIAAWVGAFKQKRNEIEDRRCDEPYVRGLRSRRDLPMPVQPRFDD